MAEVNGEMGQELLHVASLTMPESESVDGKRVTEGMQRWSTLTGYGFDASQAKQPDECQPLGVVVEPSAVTVDEERFYLPTLKHLSPLAQIEPQMLRCRGMENDIARLAELALAYEQMGRGRIEPCIFNRQVDRLSDAQAGACEQPKQSGEGERTHVAARAYLRNGIDQADDILIGKQVWSPPAVEWLEDVVRDLCRRFKDAHLQEKSAGNIKAPLIPVRMLAVRSDPNPVEENRGANRPRGTLFVPVGDETSQQFFPVLQATAIPAVPMWIASGYSLPEREKLFCKCGQCGKVHRAPPGHGSATCFNASRSSLA